MKSYELATIYILSIQPPFKNLLLVILSSQLLFEKMNSAKDIIVIPKVSRGKIFNRENSNKNYLYYPPNIPYLDIYIYV